MGKSNIRIYQKEQQESSQIGLCKYPTNDELKYLFKHYDIDTYLKIKLPEGFNPKNAKKGLWIQRVQLKEDINKSLPDLYSLIEDSKLETPRTKKTIGDSLLKSLENCLNVNNNEHKSPPNVTVKQFPDDNYKPVSEPKKESYLSIKYKNPEIEKKIKTIIDLVKNLDVKNPKIDQLLYKLAKSKPS